jgi:nitrate/nitrite transporter NarK
MGNTAQADISARIRDLWASAGGPANNDLVVGLNAVLQRPELFQPTDRSNWSLPREALRLAALPNDALTPNQIERRNRLLLEAVYPDHIRKLYSAGWRPVVLVYGLAGLVVAALFCLGFRNRPREHPGCNEAELALIEEGRPQTSLDAGQPLPSFPLSGVLTNFSFLMNCVAQFTTNFGWIFLLTWLPRYLAEVHRVPVEERGLMASVPIFVGIAGMAMGGWLTDRTTLAFGLRWGRSAVLAASRFVAMAAFITSLSLHTPWTVTAAFAVVAWSTDLGTPSMWAYAQDVGGRYVASILGWGNMCGNIGAALSPIVLNKVEAKWGWDAALWTCAGAFLLSGIASLGIDATSKLVSKDAE